VKGKPSGKHLIFMVGVSLLTIVAYERIKGGNVPKVARMTRAA
jgi:hypothetical protein